RSSWTGASASRWTRARAATSRGRDQLSGLVLAGFGLGLLLAAQVGPVTLLVVCSILRGGRALVIGLAMAVAIAGIDVLYATLGLVGAGKLTSGADVRLVLGLASAAILCAIGLRTMWNGL